MIMSSNNEESNIKHHQQQQSHTNKQQSTNIIMNPNNIQQSTANQNVDQNSTATTSSVKVTIPVVVSTTSSSNAPITSLASPANNSTNNKKHNLGYHLRRLLFPRFRSTTGTTLSKHRSTVKDTETNNENQNFLRHSTSLYSTSSGDSEHHRASSSKQRRRIRNKSAQTDTVPELPTLSGQLNASPSVSKPNAQGLIECSICLLEQALSQYIELSTCNHRPCLTCLRLYLRIEILESRINITCPECNEALHPNDIHTILRNDMNLFEKYESFMVRRILITDPDARWCPAPDCDYCVIANGCASCPKLKCERPGCETLFCYHCKQEWHPNQTCDQARAQRGTSRYGSTGSQTKPSGVTFSNRSAESSQAHPSTSGDAAYSQRDDIKPCPCCKVLIIKMDDGSCNHMTCSFCGTEFCWLCMQKISDLHYLSPSGCTFWGKKPWSRKKKIMWQLGMLVGAPVGIALIAGIAVPAIIIGIPVWVGRKLYARFERNHLSRHKSNLLVTTGVLTSIFVSPILAAVAVGIGVPILLAYVYGVVPISLCRSGGCGVSTSTSGVRIELDEDEISANVAPDGVSVDTALSGHRGIANPSIGEVSLGMSTSLSIGSSSHLDRVVLDIQPDREGSSISACAGSITSHMLHANASTLTNKLETHADITPNKRYSFSSQNADASSVTLSLGDRSINTNISVDDASLKVLTGSIRDGHNSQTGNGNYSLSPVEVHVNICGTSNSNSGNNNDEESSILADTKSSSTITQTKATKSNDSQQMVGQSTSGVLGKYESRSLEYLSNNYCKFCHKSHKPCCPNFHPNNSAIKIGNKFSDTNSTSRTVGGEDDDDDNDPYKSQLDVKANVTLTSESMNKNEKMFNRDSTSIMIDDGDDNVTSSSSSSHSSGMICSRTIPVDSSSHHDSSAFLNRPNTLPKKAISQIFYPNIHFNSSQSPDDNRTNQSRTAHHYVGSSKSTLSHSLSFTHNNNLIIEKDKASY